MTPTVTFRGLDRSPVLERSILRRVANLSKFYKPIMACHVLVELAQRHHERGNHFHVRIDLTVPRGKIVIAHNGNLYGAARDLQGAKNVQRAETHPERKHAAVAVREAFDTARRQLQDFARRQRGDVKSRALKPRGRVTRLFPAGEYGYIEAPDGHEIYFQKSSVLRNGFDRLAVGSPVVFDEERGDKGPQASTVKLMRER